MSIAKKISYLNELRHARRKFGGGWLSATKRFYELTGPRRYSPNEIFMLGLMDPALGAADLDRFISKEAMLARQQAVNPRSHYDLTEDKLVFYRHCTDNELPTPRILGALGAQGDWPEDVAVASTVQGWRGLCANLDVSELVIKPVNGVHGESVMLLNLENGVFETHSGEKFDADDLLAKMHHSDYSNWILQQRLHAHPDIVDVSGSANLQTARVVSWLDGNGDPQILFAWLRIIGSSEAFDNFNFGAAGNFVATIDLETAELRYVLGAASDGHGLVEVESHPATGMLMKGFSVPHGKDMFEVVKRAAESFKPLRTIGWDVAITPDGVALIEGNVTWDPLPTREDLATIATLQ